MNGRVSVETTFLTCFFFWDWGAEVGSAFFTAVALRSLLDSVGGGGGDSIGRLPFLVRLWARGTSSASSAKASLSSSASLRSASSLSCLSRDLVTWSTVEAAVSKLRGSKTSSTCGASGGSGSFVEGCKRASGEDSSCGFVGEGVSARVI